MSNETPKSKRVNLKNDADIVRSESGYAISPDRFVFKEDFNLRKTYGNIEELADDIEINGIKEPIRFINTDEHGLVVIDGHRRLMAIEVLKKRGVVIQKVRALPDDSRNIAQMYANMMRYNNKRLKFEPIELGSGFARILIEDPSLEFNDFKGLSKLTGFSSDEIEASLKILSLPEESKKMVEEKTLPKKHALTIAESTNSLKTQRELSESALLSAKNAGRKRINDSDIVKAMEERNIPEAKIRTKSKQGTGRIARFKMFEEFFNDSFADLSRLKAFQGGGLVIDFINGEIKTIKELKKKIESV